MDENEQMEKELVRVSASDFDFGLNSTVRYQLVSRMNSFFSIQTKTGLISIRKPLDREVSETYKLIIQEYWDNRF